MAFGVYVHIPYCLQRCTYCDFATYEHTKIMPPDQYVDLVLKEIRQHSGQWTQKNLDTIYFGGGTPSLISSQHIVAIIDELGNNGFTKSDKTEITIEINPATLDPKKMETYLKAGINRFSVGAQTFDDRLLKMVHREHNAQQTRETLQFLKNYGVNYSFDILFALPTQTKDGLKKDLEEVLAFRPNHVSPYCLTVPEGHVLSSNRPLEDDQIEMFEMIKNHLQSAGYRPYEISNFCLPGFESRHNCLYWDDQEYWGVGLSSHSFKKTLPWGERFWNPNSIGSYQNFVEASLLPEKEQLLLHQALTDFFHTSLRRSQGLIFDEFTAKFGHKRWVKIQPILQQLQQNTWLENPISGQWRLTQEGILVSNQVFAALTFLKQEIN